MKSWWCIVDMGVAIARTTKSQTLGNGKTFHLCEYWQCIQNLTVACSFSWLLLRLFPYRDLLWRPPSEQAQSTWCQLFCACVCFFIPGLPMSSFQDQAMHPLAAPFIGVLDSKITQTHLSDLSPEPGRPFLMDVLRTWICLCSKFLSAVNSNGLEKICTPVSEFHS